MKLTHAQTCLFDQNQEASPGAGGNGGVESKGTLGPAPDAVVAPTPTNKDVWGNREAPTWTKTVGIEKKHNEADAAAGVVAKLDAAGNPVTQENKDQGIREESALKLDANGNPLVPFPGAKKVEVQQQAPAQQQVTPTAPAPFDVKVFAQEMARAMQPQQQQGGQQQAAPTAEQVRQQLAIYEPTAQDYEDILGVKPDKPERVQALNRVLQAIAKQAATVATVLNQNSLQDFQRRMDPYVAAARTQEAENQKKIFYTEHKDLDGYQALVEKEFTALVASGYKVSNVAEARKAVADRTRETLKTLGITPKAVAAQQQTQQGQQQRQASGGQSPGQSRQMAPTSGGGRGAGSAQNSGAPVSKIQAVWG